MTRAPKEASLHPAVAPSRPARPPAAAATVGRLAATTARSIAAPSSTTWCRHPRARVETTEHSAGHRSVVRHSAGSWSASRRPVVRTSATRIASANAALRSVVVVATSNGELPGSHGGLGHGADRHGDKARDRRPDATGGAGHVAGRMRVEVQGQAVARPDAGITLGRRRPPVQYHKGLFPGCPAHTGKRHDSKQTPASPIATRASTSTPATSSSTASSRWCKRAHRPEVLAGIGGFGALVELPPGRWKRPVLVSGTDGVGTKLKLAIDRAATTRSASTSSRMCVNDVAVQGAEPLFFLDYFATGKLAVDVAESVVARHRRGLRAGRLRADRRRDRRDAGHVPRRRLRPRRLLRRRGREGRASSTAAASRPATW